MASMKPRLRPNASAKRPPKTAPMNMPPKLAEVISATESTGMCQALMIPGAAKAKVLRSASSKK